MYVYICMYVCTCVCSVCMYVCMYVRTYVCIYDCMYVCMYDCMYRVQNNELDKWPNTSTSVSPFTKVRIWPIYIILWIWCD